MRLSAKTLAINATVVTALVGGGVAYITLDNAVALTVDGKTETVHTFGGSQRLRVIDYLVSRKRRS